MLEKAPKTHKDVLKDATRDYWVALFFLLDEIKFNPPTLRGAKEIQTGFIVNGRVYDLYMREHTTGIRVWESTSWKGTYIRQFWYNNASKFPYMKLLEFLLKDVIDHLDKEGS